MEAIGTVIGRIIDKARVATGFRTIFDASGLALGRIENGSDKKAAALITGAHRWLEPIQSGAYRISVGCTEGKVTEGSSANSSRLARGA